ncbi:hypothetical protein [Neisseria dumasiana]|uniref:hypothetical protein n=1 Tax=Neisseria dumasiana TaxID=1931275 RepID=UPI001301E307|nr:hypothetical protein [Neisseria dumasiana]
MIATKASSRDILISNCCEFDDHTERAQWAADVLRLKVIGFSDGLNLFFSFVFID